MNKEQLIEYINLYNQFQNNQNMQFTNEQINFINSVHNEAQSNQELATFLSNVTIINEQERMNALNVYIKEQELKNQGSNLSETIPNQSNEYMNTDIENANYYNQQIETYYNYPELLEYLPEEEKNQWKQQVESYEQKLQKEEQLQKENAPKKLVYKKPDKKAGYADVLLLSLITGFLGGVLTTLTTILFTK